MPRLPRKAPLLPESPTSPGKPASPGEAGPAEAFPAQTSLAPAARLPHPARKTRDARAGAGDFLVPSGR